ncbi:unnamed protein product [Amoebophrya sp. A120]|nr:unnamed protein product [Amoebophrya sp. A120]|eukprot:GSA120T00025451001.1
MKFSVRSHAYGVLQRALGNEKRVSLFVREVLASKHVHIREDLPSCILSDLCRAGYQDHCHFLILAWERRKALFVWSRPAQRRLEPRFPFAQLLTAHYQELRDHTWAPPGCKHGNCAGLLANVVASIVVADHHGASTTGVAGDSSARREVVGTCFIADGNKDATSFYSQPVHVAVFARPSTNKSAPPLQLAGKRLVMQCARFLVVCLGSRSGTLDEHADGPHEAVNAYALVANALRKLHVSDFFKNIEGVEFLSQIRHLLERHAGELRSRTDFCFPPAPRCWYYDDGVGPRSTGGGYGSRVQAQEEHHVLPRPPVSSAVLAMLAHAFPDAELWGNGPLQDLILHSLLACSSSEEAAWSPEELCAICDAASRRPRERAIVFEIVLGVLRERLLRGSTGAHVQHLPRTARSAQDGPSSSTSVVLQRHSQIPAEEDENLFTRSSRMHNEAEACGGQRGVWTARSVASLLRAFCKAGSSTGLPRRTNNYTEQDETSSRSTTTRGNNIAQRLYGERLANILAASKLLDRVSWEDSSSELSVAIHAIGKLPRGRGDFGGKQADEAPGGALDRLLVSLLRKFCQPSPRVAWAVRDWANVMDAVSFRLSRLIFLPNKHVERGPQLHVDPVISKSGDMRDEAPEHQGLRHISKPFRTSVLRFMQLTHEAIVCCSSSCRGRRPRELEEGNTVDRNSPPPRAAVELPGTTAALAALHGPWQIQDCMAGLVGVGRLENALAGEEEEDSKVKIRRKIRGPADYRGNDFSFRASTKRLEVFECLLQRLRFHVHELKFSQLSDVFVAAGKLRARSVPVVECLYKQFLPRVEEQVLAAVSSGAPRSSCDVETWKCAVVNLLSALSKLRHDESKLAVPQHRGNKKGVISSWSASQGVARLLVTACLKTTSRNHGKGRPGAGLLKLSRADREQIRKSCMRLGLLTAKTAPCVSLEDLTC